MLTPAGSHPHIKLTYFTTSMHLCKCQFFTAVSACHLSLTSEQKMLIKGCIAGCAIIEIE